MPEITDPAKEFALLCERLAAPQRVRGDNYLASKMSVPGWSSDFYKVIFCISERADGLIGIINTLDTDNDIKKQAIRHVEKLKQAFQYDALTTTWDAGNGGASFLRAENIQPVKMLSAQVRAKVSYPKLDDSEKAEILALIENLLKWLAEHQLREQDFIRQAIIDGINQFKFRFERLDWLGWGYTLESLREVIGAYMALERGIASPSTQPDAAALLKKLAGFVEKFYEKTQLAKELVESGDFILRIYGSITLIQQAATGISGLLPPP